MTKHITAGKRHCLKRRQYTTAPYLIVGFSMYKMEILLVALFRLAMDEDGEETVNEMLIVCITAE